MSIPTKWYGYLLSGAIFLSSFLFMLHLDTTVFGTPGRRSWLSYLPQEIIGSALTLALASSAMGMIMNAAMIFFTEKSFDAEKWSMLHDRIELYHELQDGNDTRILLRSLCLAFSLLSIVALGGLLWFWDHPFLRIPVILISAVGAVSLRGQYVQFGENHQAFFENCIARIRQEEL